MNWQAFVAFRYLTAKRKEKFISLISLISILGVAVGVSSLIIVIAVMSGFDNELKDKIIGTNSHMTVESEYGVAPSGELISKVLGTEHVMAASFFIHGQALLRAGENTAGVILKGIEPKGEAAVSKIGQYIESGALDPGEDGVVAGSEFVKRFRLRTGDRITAVTPACPKGKDLVLRGIFASGMYEYDANLVYVRLAAAQELFGVKGLTSGISVRLDDAMNVAGTKRRLQTKLGFPYIVRTWMDMNKNLLAALKLEKTVMFIILTLIVMVACFNIASALIMTVLEKTKDIGILKAIGATNFDIMSIFAVQGAMIGFLGTALGAVFGVAVCWCLKTYKFITLPRDIYYIDKLPVMIEPQDIALIIISSLALSLVATLYPSRKASRLDPVEALRYE